MSSFDDTDAKAIMDLPLSEARTLFPGGRSEVQKRFAELAKRWHPDHASHPDATRVFARILDLRDAALPCAVAGSAKGSASELVFDLAAGGSVKFSALSANPVETGEVLVGARSVTSHISAENADLADRAIDRMATFAFADDRMRREMTPFLPQAPRHMALRDGSALLAVSRPKGHVLLADLCAAVAARGETFDPRHAAWITSGLLNIAAWLSYARLSHGAISLSTVAVNPETHSVALLAGWEMATSFDESPVVATDRALSLMPDLGLPGRTATARLDLLLIRDVLRELTGGSNAAALLSGDGRLPGPLALWAVLPPPDDAVSDYRAWLQALEDAWGPRRFLRFPLTETDVYGRTARDPANRNAA